MAHIGASGLGVLKVVAVSEFSQSADRVAAGVDARTEADRIVLMMTLEEKLGCLDGDLPFWPGMAEMMGGGYTSRTWPAAVVDRLGIPGLHFADGPRGCVIGPSTTFPVSMARGASFDPDLEYRIGQVIGSELRAAGATYTGAVCMNLLRHPAWGRAQETYGEDPYHVGEMAVALTEGLQEHVMACMKHYAMNSMENARFKVDITADERTLHEVYLPHFKRVAQSGVASVMTAYNSVNGEWCGENYSLLTSILRDEWEWDGFVITDFIAGLRDPVCSVAAGCNIEMPFAQQRSTTLTDAVQAGTLEVADIDARVAETIATFLRFAHVFAASPSTELLASRAHRELAREAATSSIVMLSNNGLLPLDSTRLTKVAVLGRLAAVPNLGDAGSSNVLHSPDPVTPLAGLRSGLGSVEVVHSDNDLEVMDGADVVIVVVGFSKADEGEYLGSGLADALMPLMPPMDHPTLGSDDPAVIGAIAAMAAPPRGDDSSDNAAQAEGGDRDSLRLREDEEQLIAAACAAHDNVIVAVVAGSTVVMPWLDMPDATLMLWYAGSEGGTALAGVLAGDEPGGRLPFAVPVDETDLVTFDKEADSFTYHLLHGQWWLDANQTPPHLPFGHGLSYAHFSYSDPTIDGSTVSVTVTNAADRGGSTVVQVYGSVPTSRYLRPAKRLVGFMKVHLDGGDSELLEIPIDLTPLDIRVDGEWIRENESVDLSLGFNAASTTQVVPLNPR